MSEQNNTAQIDPKCTCPDTDYFGINGDESPTIQLVCRTGKGSLVYWCGFCGQITVKKSTGRREILFRRSVNLKQKQK